MPAILFPDLLLSLVVFDFDEDVPFNSAYVYSTLLDLFHLFHFGPVYF